MIPQESYQLNQLTLDHRFGNGKRVTVRSATQVSPIIVLQETSRMPSSKMCNESTYRLKTKEFNDREDDADCMKDLSSIFSTDKLVDYEEQEDNIP